ncbi:Oidioi.mRNA.OKI2018_I69.PAR.g11855.t1.cds [Oikopleura dioica]|uniref:Oidioi.mRNA.OKI2018_I69.PAR.g11855.t1.cds n=1 Tax=Oikopleura dioica TaxID=34765 RepID=A0ABN7S1W6_OIKDI|nr:Oidioi.mRNA.OKI2018_I69.PAR.g11855.t1.cds [Oikopleura dioica]
MGKSDESLEKQRKLYMIAVAVWYFSAGADRALIIPTVNAYLTEYLGAAQVYMGVVISIFAIGSIIAAPSLGRICDWLGTSRPLLIFGVSLHLTGSIIYFLAPGLPGTKPEMWIVFGRFLAGIGYGLDAPVVGTLTRNAPPENRGSVIASAILMRQVGVIIGPFCMLFLKYANFTLPGGVQINPYNVQGFFLMCIWASVLTVIILLYHDAGLAYEESETIPEDDDVNLTASIHSLHFKWKETKDITSGGILKLLLREQVVVCLVGSFGGMFLQSSLETVFTPLSKRFLGFTSVQNAMTYVFIGVVAVSGYFCMKLISDRPGFQQRRALLIGMSVEFLNTVILTTTVPNATFRATYLYILTGVVVLLQCFFMAWLVVASASLLSKFTPQYYQSSIQGVRIGVETLATILAPLWISSTINFSIYACFSIPTFILITGCILTTSSYHVLEPSRIDFYPLPSPNSKKNHDNRQEDTELANIVKILNKQHYRLKAFAYAKSEIYKSLLKVSQRLRKISSEGK